MVVNIVEAVEFVSDIAQHERVKTSVKGALKGGVMVGCAAAAGALCLGPIGLAVGGAVGGIGAAISARDTFQPLPEVVANMSPQEKALLAGRVERFVQDFDVTDLATLAMMVAGNDRLREKVVQELIQYLTQEMRIAIA